MVTYEDVPARFNLTRYFLDRHLEEGRQDRTALVCGTRRVTYGELASLANRVGNVLRELGTEPEHRVLLALSDGVEFVATWYAALKIGAVSAEVYTFLTVADYAYYLDYVRPRVVVTDPVTHDRIRDAARQTNFRGRILAVGVEDLRPGEISFDRAVAEAPDELRGEDTAKDDFALWKFTTGTTGRPKAVVHCHYAPYLSFWNYAQEVIRYRPDDVVLPVPKLFFGYARDCTALFPFGVGASGVVFPERSTPERMFELIAAHRPTILVLVPTMIHAMLAHAQAGRADLSCVRLATSAGEALPAELYHRWKAAFGVEVLDGIGSSELYHIYISNRLDDVLPGSVGRPCPGYRAEVRNPEGASLPPGEVGELWVWGETAALLYWKDRGKSVRTFHGNWVRTGDLFSQDEDGRFLYRGRADDLMKVGGIWVAPMEIEACLLTHPLVAECAVVPYTEGGLVLPRAYVVLREPQRASPEVARELQAYVRGRLSPHKFPRDVHFAESLPRTPSGKVDRKQLRSTE
ncbi:MAG: benzoate-CoA ligase family protein [Armatimonadota bacterium]|nr:benzoate-CoA ligase family protein [Armatimonadota bacterium]MDR5696965.1 benzoate-CoA ligase family protein [Armatimonadota bacterium]